MNDLRSVQPECYLRSHKSACDLHFVEPTFFFPQTLVEPRIEIQSRLELDVLRVRANRDGDAALHRFESSSLEGQILPR